MEDVNEGAGNMSGDHMGQVEKILVQQSGGKSVELWRGWQYLISDRNGIVTTNVLGGDLWQGMHL